MVKKKVVITGGSDGIGYELVLFFLSKNYTIYTTYFSSKKNLIALKRIHKKRIFFQKMDLGNSKNITSFVKNIKKKFKSPDLIILNAINKFKRKKFDLIKMSEFKLNFKKNIIGNFFIIQSLIKLIVTNKKITILHISSNVSKKGSWGLSGYGPSKAAIDNLFKCLQHEYKNKIKFKSIFFGAINTSGYRYTNGIKNIHKTTSVKRTRLKVLKYI